MTGFSRFMPLASSEGWFIVDLKGQTELNPDTIRYVCLQPELNEPTKFSSCEQADTVAFLLNKGSDPAETPS